MKNIFFSLDYFKMASLNFDQFVLIFSVLLLFYITINVNKIESYSDPLIDRIKNDLIKVDDRVHQLHFQASNESFTEDKKNVYLCLKDKNGEYYDYNMLMYVSLHELAHAFSTSVDENHTTDEFKNNFRKLLKKAEDIGIYDPKKPLIYDYCPH